MNQKLQLSKSEMATLKGGTQDQSDDSNKFKDKQGNWHWNTCDGFGGPGMVCSGCAPAPKSEL